MDTQRAFVAILLSLVILLGYQYLFVRTPPGQVQGPAVTEPQVEPAPTVARPGPAAPSQAPVAAPAAVVQPARQGRDIAVETDLFAAVITETGGGVKSFKLKKYMDSMEPDSDYKELVTTEAFAELPLYFSWGVGPEKAEIPVFTASRESVVLGQGRGREASLRMEATLSSGLTIVRTMTFDNANYLANLEVEVRNTTDTPLQGAPYLGLTNLPFNPDSQRYLFAGPAVLVNDSLEEIKVSDLNKKGPKTLSGRVDWAAYEGNYFMCGMIPGQKDKVKVLLSAEGDKVRTVLSAGQDVIPAQGRKLYAYSFYFGPKKVSTLKATGHNLERIVNFGWFDKMARPVLYLLNFLYRYVHNYGVAIILVTVLIKLVLWPISHKGMKSMKNMQAIQPKIAKLREKYKDDSTRMNQEMMNLYKTYKVNPLGGCLPMFLQIPVFFALYKVLLQAIELRHAPFMLWITDLAAPDRLWIGIDIPYLHGLPVLTLLMGASMFLQQKMTPSPADPTQAKIMLFLPLIFTFMFINFASGLVLYWFVNNLLAIAQQYIVNRPAKS